MKAWRAESAFMKAWRAEGAFVKLWRAKSAFMKPGIKSVDRYGAMKTLHLDTSELGLDFNAALKLATAIARQQLGDDTMLLSWYDRERDLEHRPG